MFQYQCSVVIPLTMHQSKCSKWHFVRQCFDRGERGTVDKLRLCDMSAEYMAESPPPPPPPPPTKMLFYIGMAQSCHPQTKLHHPHTTINSSSTSRSDSKDEEKSYFFAEKNKRANILVASPTLLTEIMPFEALARILHLWDKISASNINSSLMQTIT